MAATTELPTWAVYAISFGTPASAFVGGLIGHLVTRRGAKELERRSRREEVMRNLRWAAELAVHEDDRTARLGVSQLDALAESDLLDETQQAFLDAALESVVRTPREELAELADAGEDAEVVELSIDEETTATGQGGVVVPLGEDQERREGGTGD